MEKTHGVRLRPLRATVVKKQEEAAAAAAALAASPSRGGRSARCASGSHEHTIQVLLQLPGFAWKEDQTWYVNYNGMPQCSPR